MKRAWRRLRGWWRCWPGLIVGRFHLWEIDTRSEYEGEIKHGWYQGSYPDDIWKPHFEHWNNCLSRQLGFRPPYLAVLYGRRFTWLTDDITPQERLLIAAQRAELEGRC